MTLRPKILLPIILTLGFAGLLLGLVKWSENPVFTISDNSYLTRQFNYQLLLLPVTALSLLSTYLLNRQHFRTYFSFGQLSAPGQELRLFGIKKGDSWLHTGLSLCVVISVVTAVFLYFQLSAIHPDWAALPQGICWVLLFSLSNSFGEEMIFRLGIVSPLSGLLSPRTLFLISGVLFGIPHFAGMPSGITGIAMAGVLGYVLAKSMYETRGFFWAWLIHFIQDVLIMSSLFLLYQNAGR